MKKPSEIFEGENSSLRRTFDSVSMTKEEEILEAWLKKHRKDGHYIDGGNNYVEYSLDGCFNLHALVSSIRREAIAEERERVIKEIYKFGLEHDWDNQVMSDINSYLSYGIDLSHLTQE